MAAGGHQRVKLELKPFEGKTSSPLEARIFIRKVEAYGAVCGLSPEQLAQAASFAFSGPASRWFGTFEEAEDPRIDTWPTLRLLFEERFCRVHSSSELSRFLRDLRQKVDESVDDFYDRCQELQFLEHANISAATRQAVEFSEIHNNGVTLKFINGLKKSIRDRAVISDATTLEGVVSAARRVETTFRDDNVKSAAPVLEVNHGQDGQEGVDPEAYDEFDNGAGEGQDDGQSDEHHYEDSYESNVHDGGQVDAVGRGGYARRYGSSSRGNYSSGRGFRGGFRGGFKGRTTSAPSGYPSGAQHGGRYGGQGNQGGPANDVSQTVGPKCHNCGHYGHIRAACPLPQNPYNGYVRAVMPSCFHGTNGTSGGAPAVSQLRQQQVQPGPGQVQAVAGPHPSQAQSGGHQGFANVVQGQGLLGYGQEDYYSSAQPIAAISGLSLMERVPEHGRGVVETQQRRHQGTQECHLQTQGNQGRFPTTYSHNDTGTGNRTGTGIVGRGSGGGGDSGGVPEVDKDVSGRGLLNFGFAGFY